MRRFPSFIVLGLLIQCLLWSLPGLAQEGQSIGSVVSLQGQASVQRAGNTQPLQVRSPVYQHDEIRTLAASKITITLRDGTELRLGEESTLTLSQFVYAPQQQSHNVVLRVLTGTFRAIANTVLPQATFELQTATAVAAIRGTEWLGQVSADATAIFVAQGTVAVRHVDPRIGGEVLVTAGMGTDVRGQSPPTAPKQWGAARIEALQQAVLLP